MTNVPVAAPETTRTGALPGILLLAASCLSVLAAVLLAPIVPQLQAQFPDSPVPVPLVISAPALAIALFAPFAGQIVDRVGRRNLLFGAMILYGIVGTAPAWLPEAVIGQSIVPLLLLRFLVGIAEGAIMTAATTMLADYYHGDRRNRYLALQTVYTTISATVFLILGGALGAAGWNVPFWVYGLSIVILIPMLYVITEPRPTAEEMAERAARPKTPIPWRRLALRLVVAVFGGFAFFVILAESALVYNGVGITDPQQIGLVSAVAALATAVASLLFPKLAPLTAKVLLPLALGLLGAGMILTWLTAQAQFVPGVIGAAVVSSLGAGLLLPTMLVWTVGNLSFDERGRSTGLWQAAFFLGQFVSPIIVQIIQGGPGDGDDTLPAAIGAIGIATVVVGLVLAVAVKREPMSASHTSS